MSVLPAVCRFRFRFFHLAHARDEFFGLRHEVGLRGRRFEFGKIGFNARLGKHFYQSLFHGCEGLSLAFSVVDAVDSAVDFAKIGVRQTFSVLAISSSNS